MRILGSLALALAVIGPAPALAEPPAFEPFTFKRLKPPTGTGPRINVQITAPLPTPVRLVAGPARTPRTKPVPRPDGARDADVALARATPQNVPRASMADEPAASRHAEWFWGELSPGPVARGSGPARLIAASQHVAASGRARMPTFDTVTGIVRAHGPQILRHSVGTRVSPALAVAVIAVESAGRSQAVSHAGAMGLMQLMPATAKRFGVTDRSSPNQNIMGGIAYLDWLLGHFDGDPLLALAAYNAGEGAVARFGGVPPYRETREYVPKVIAAWQIARQLCATPPVLAADGCAFALPG